MREWEKMFLALAAAFCLLLAACGSREEPPGDYRVVVGTDLHYMAPSLTDHGEIFWHLMEAGDGKVTEYCEEITDAFLEETLALRPEALILTGDLSFNGERESHLALAQKLAALEEAGVPVLVLPGNHDVYRGSCYSYIGDTAERVPSVTAEEFREIYAAFGFDEAIARDDDSLSYTAQLNDSTRVLMLDANTIHDYCGLSEKTLAWIDAQLGAAEEAGQGVLAACHQNLYQHSMFKAGYILHEAEQLHALLEKHHVPLLLSGHMHIQHIHTQGEVTEIATSALGMGACQYGVLESKRGTLRYEARRVDVSAWAEARGTADENLLRFAEYAQQRMERQNRVQAQTQLQDRGFSPEEIGPLTDYACALNSAYFAGDLSVIPALDPDGSLLLTWEKSGTFFGAYFATLEKEIGVDYTHWEKERGA